MESENVHTYSFYTAESLGQTLGSCITHVLGWPFTSKQQVRPLGENCGWNNPSAGSDHYCAKRRCDERWTENLEDRLQLRLGQTRALQASGLAGKIWPIGILAWEYNPLRNHSVPLHGLNYSLSEEESVIGGGVRSTSMQWRGLSRCTSHHSIEP